MPLKPVPQQAGGDAVSEAYIQALVHEHPACLPIAEIDAMFAGPVEAIAEYLQLHAGLHFSLGLVELPIYAMPNGDRLVAPRVLARTALVTRNVVAVHLVDRVSVAYAMHAILDEWKAGGAVKDQLGGDSEAVQNYAGHPGHHHRHVAGRIAGTAGGEKKGVSLARRAGKHLCERSASSHALRGRRLPVTRRIGPQT